MLAHYMPWYEAAPEQGQWGWHWTMNHFDPNREDERRAIASHYYPAIGPYDSGDAKVIEYHLLLMKIAGIDGVIVDWYGREEFRDYALLHRNTARLIEQANRLRMRVVICYEDQTIPALVEANRIAADQRVAHAIADLEWLQANWFKEKCYLRFYGKPVLLSFGQSGLSDDEWSETLQAVDGSVAYVSQHHRRSSALGAFDWPVPQEGLAAIDRFERESKTWPLAISVAFPRFHDIYAEAQVHASWGHVADKEGATFRDTFLRAVRGKSAVVQIATWNDWGEGTQIEPSREFGWRDLETIQQYRLQVDQAFPYNRNDLQLPLRLYERRAKSPTPENANLDRLAENLAAGRVQESRRALAVER
ncbi:MAG: hypothetical protein KDA62_01565 [Planctomycetales bacterium]|nr:hypothetical protein [Planctomycetales bacterium]